ncbi:hypothetical protein M0R72_12155 [Candidatus Pacearchaeota archaeon]|nr:hypothetical protein [Candidatus Pacearchaeota archaeon]
MVQIWKSKTLWVNVLAAIGLFASTQFGYQLSAEMTGLALAGINSVLRAVTNEPLEW